jgi:hypothetical protein
MFPITLDLAQYKTKYFRYLSQYQTEFGIYAPTGKFESGAPANIGRNCWTFEPSAVASYLDRSAPASAQLKRHLLQFTITSGFDFNTKNGAIHYQTGDQFHLDGTLAAYRVLWRRRGSVGDCRSGVSADSSVNRLPEIAAAERLSAIFEAMTTGVGPDLSYKNKYGDLTLGGEVKWLPELS